METAPIYRLTLQNLKGVTEPAINAKNGCNHPFIRARISKLGITPRNIQSSNVKGVQDYQINKQHSFIGRRRSQGSRRMDDSKRKHYSLHEWAIQTVYDYIKQNVGKQKFVIIKNPSTSFYKITQKGKHQKARVH